MREVYCTHGEYSRPLNVVCRICAPEARTRFRRFHIQWESPLFADEFPRQTSPNILRVEGRQLERMQLKKITVLAMMCALAYVVMLVGRVPIVLFLKYDPKDVIITIGGFIYGPMAAFAISALVSLVEMVTVSDTGIIGCIMNILASCSFACSAAYLYKRHRSMKGAVLGLVAGWLIMTAVMLLWNYFITPYYMGYPREAVAELLVPAFLPFNLLKGGLNAAITMLLYKPIVTGLRRARLLPEPVNEKGRKINIGVILVSLLVLTTFVLLTLIFMGVL